MRAPLLAPTGVLALVALLALVACVACACNPASKEPEPIATVPRTEAPASKLGAAIDPAAPQVSLADVAKTPRAFAGKTFTTAGTITAVCQHMGCWMEIKDDAGEAHVKMEGHAFFIPKTASGRRARVLATLEPADAPPSCEDGKGNDESCGADKDDKQKLALVAKGVELL